VGTHVLRPAKVRSNRPHMLSRRAEVFGTALLLCAPLFGIDRDLRIEQLQHTSWTHKDGVPGQILSLAQTTDGFLWIGARDGLYRFDGLHFERYQPGDGRTLPSAEAGCLLAAPDGGLWIAYGRRATIFVKDGKINTYPDPEGLQGLTTHDLVRDDQGVIWRAATTSGLFRFAGSRWERVGADWGFSGGAYNLHVDRAGTLWVDTFHGLVLLPKGSHRFQRPASLASGWGPFSESRDGTIWILDWTPPNVPKIRSAQSGLVLREFDKQARVYKMILDQQGSLWVGTVGRGINRNQYPERANGKNSQEMNATADIFRQRDGLSGDTVMDLLEDREGDIWVATNGGLDRFRQSPLITVKFPPDAVSFTLSAQENGDALVTSMFGKDNLVIIRNGRATALKSLAAHIHASYRDPYGVSWIGTDAGILGYSTNQLSRIDLPGPPSKSTDVYPFSITMDQAGRLLALFTLDGPRRLENGQWTDLTTLGVPKSCGIILATDSAGRVWEGCSDNRIVLLEGNNVRMFRRKDGLNVGNVEALGTRKDSVWIGGTGGLQRFDGHRFATVDPADGSVFRAVKGIVATADNGIWFGEERGIIHIEDAETRRIEKNPDYRVKYQAFDILDGLSDVLQTYYPAPNMIEGTDGRLWFATAQGVVWLDPKRIPTRPFPPTPAVISVTTNDHSYDLPAPSEIKLPPHTVNLQFAYTAPSLAIPERVRFRYKLDGSDKEWRSAGSRREASYTNLGPGSYRFHVMASNSDGVWNKTEAVTDFIIQPALYQMHWFYALCVCAALGILWGLYRLRLGQMSARLSAQMQGRLEARFAERERIARELHDTLLQGFQGLTLHFQAVMEQIPDREPARQSMKKALTYADAVLLEGRQRVRELRLEDTKVHELSQQIAAYGEELVKDRAIVFNVTVVGTPQPLHPVVSDEIYRIAREALVNAFRHSQSAKIEVEITYDAANVCLRVRDDGAGIGPEVLAGGKDGHWGLSGMRERAHNIGAQMNVLSNPGSGTEVDLTLPAKVAYVGSPKRRWWYWIAPNNSGGR
jgi:signal transduction histidine kinase/ligand-binding sensor domain-containing protein